MVLLFVLFSVLCQAWCLSSSEAPRRWREEVYFGTLAARRTHANRATARSTGARRGTLLRRGACRAREARCPGNRPCLQTLRKERPAEVVAVAQARRAWIKNRARG